MQPDEIYNLGAMSHVKVSFEMSEYTAEADGVGVLRLLNAIRSAGLEKKTRLYQVIVSYDILVHMISIFVSVELECGDRIRSFCELQHDYKSKCHLGVGVGLVQKSLRCRASSCEMAHDYRAKTRLSYTWNRVFSFVVTEHAVNVCGVVRICGTTTIPIHYVVDPPIFLCRKIFTSTETKTLPLDYSSLSILAGVHL